MRRGARSEGRAHTPATGGLRAGWEVGRLPPRLSTLAPLCFGRSYTGQMWPNGVGHRQLGSHITATRSTRLCRTLSLAVLTDRRYLPQALVSSAHGPFASSRCCLEHKTRREAVIQFQHGHGVGIRVRRAVGQMVRVARRCRCRSELLPPSIQVCWFHSPEVARSGDVPFELRLPKDLLHSAKDSAIRAEAASPAS